MEACNHTNLHHCLAGDVLQPSFSGLESVLVIPVKPEACSRVLNTLEWTPAVGSCRKHQVQRPIEEQVRCCAAGGNKVMF